MSDTTNNDRERSRWAVSTPSDSTSTQPTTECVVSDQETLDAILASANARGYQKKNKCVYGNKNNKEDHQQGATSSNKNNKQIAEKGEEEEEEGDGQPVDKEKANFGLSGALAQEQVGNLKFREPPEARAPNARWRLYVFKNDQALETLHVSKQSAYLLGRDTEVVDIHLLHPSVSSQHAVLQYRSLPVANEDGPVRCQCLPYLMDLESTNGSFINDVRIDPRRYYQLKKGDVLKFGASTREYVLLTENTTSIA